MLLVCGSNVYSSAVRLFFVVGSKVCSSTSSNSSLTEIWASTGFLALYINNVSRTDTVSVILSLFCVAAIELPPCEWNLAESFIYFSLSECLLPPISISYSTNYWLCAWYGLCIGCMIYSCLEQGVKETSIF